jgi:hypothetical protein
MMLPTKSDRGIVVFHMLPSLAYERRWAAALALIAAGLAWQLTTGAIVGGAILVGCGNLLLLVRGYDNRVDPGAYDPSVQWERVELSMLNDLVNLDRKIRRWDRSAVDVSNPLGSGVFVIVAGVLVAMVVWNPLELRILGVDGLVLLVPHWITGIRRILVRPNLIVRVDMLRNLLASGAQFLEPHTVHLNVLLEGGEVRVPKDAKLKIDIAGRHEDFLGLYGQVVINEVQGTSYPYFYVVLVAKRGFGLDRVGATYEPGPKMVREGKRQGEVDVLVIRQETTKQSGYHTDEAAALRILKAGLRLAEQVAPGVAAEV